MNRRVVVSFAGGRSRVLEVPDAAFEALNEDDARTWLAERFAEYGCEPPNPMGKVLSADLMLGVARAAGEAAFADDSPWRMRYAASVLRLRGVGALEVDLAAYAVRVLP